MYFYSKYFSEVLVPSLDSTFMLSTTTDNIGVSDAQQDTLGLSVARMHD